MDVSDFSPGMIHAEEVHAAEIAEETGEVIESTDAIEESIEKEEE
jgi:hypothetical protein